MEKYVLLASPKMRTLAQAVRQAQESAIDLIDIKWDKFPDTFPNTFIEQVKEVKKSNVTFLACFDTPDTIFEQVSAMYALASLGPKSLKFLLPYFPTGTMERIDHEGQVATAHSLAQMLSAVGPAGPGPVPLYIWDIHALQIRHYFDTRSISPQFKSGISLLKERLRGQDVTVAFPDSGAYKRFKSMLEDKDGKPLFPNIICYKKRQGSERVVTVSEGEPRDRDVIIIDDLVHSGGTIIECLNALKAAGARSVSAYATHGVFERESWKKFLTAGFKEVIITDSCPTADAVRGQGPFQVLSLAPSIAAIVLE